MPSGRLRLISTIFWSTARETVRLFSPINMNTVPRTTSRPLSVAAPVRSSRPMPTSATSQILIAALLDITGADVAVVAVDGDYHVLKCQAVGSQLFRAGCYLILFGKATNRVDFSHACHVAQLRLDDPILYFAQISRCIGSAIRLFGAVLCFYRPEIDFTQASRDGPHCRRYSGREFFLGFLNPLIDQLAGKIDIRSILENHRNLRQAVTRQGTGLLQVR